MTLSIKFYDEDKVPMNLDPLRSQHDGHVGAVYEIKVYTRNIIAANYHTNVQLSLIGALGSTGWSIKFIEGERQPTEAEWDNVTSGATLSMTNIGSTAAGDTSTYFPVWIRVYCPGGTAAAINTDYSFQIDALERSVGA